MDVRDDDDGVYEGECVDGRGLGVVLGKVGAVRWFGVCEYTGLWKLG